jgi:hypothetical protein
MTAPDYLQLVKEKELLASEKQSWIRERETLTREKEALLRDRETWVKSKETAAAQAQKLQDGTVAFSLPSLSLSLSLGITGPHAAFVAVPWPLQTTCTCSSSCRTKGRADHSLRWRTHRSCSDYGTLACGVVRCVQCHANQSHIGTVSLRRISEYELGELKAQLSSKSSETESHTKRYV